MDQSDDTSMGEGAPQDSKKNGLIAVNNLNYVLEPDLSVAVNITHKDQAFQNTAYTVTNTPVRSICLFNTGADYIDMQNSQLTFDLVLRTVGAQADVNNHATHATFGPGGSALNLISRLTIASRSGDELVRITQFNQWAAQEMPEEYDESWYNTVGSAFYARPAKPDGKEWWDVPAIQKNADINDPAWIPLTTANSSTVPVDTRVHISIPCYLLGGLFKYKRLLPSMLCSGLRVEMEFESSDRAFRLYDSTAPNAWPSIDPNMPGLYNYEIQNPQFRLRSVQLTDSLQRALNEQSAVNGLEIVYCDYETTTAVIPPGGNSFNVEVRKACSRALRASARTRSYATSGVFPGVLGNYRELAFDSFTSNNVGAGQANTYQWQLGSLYFPHQRLAHRANPSHALLWHLTQWNGVPTGDTSQPGTINRRNFDGNAQTLLVSLERSSLFALSGVPINNSRVLALQYLGDAANAANVQTLVTCYLKYVKLARVFLLNIEVEQ